MDGHPPQHGSSSATTLGDAVVPIGSAPLSPWLRLADRFDYAGLHSGDRRRVRSITDWMLMLQVAGDSWIWWEPSAGCIALPRGAVALVPPRVPHALAELGIAYAIHFDLLADPAVEPLDMLLPSERLITAGPPLPSPLLTLRRPGRGGDLPVPLISRVDAPALWAERCERLSVLYRAGDHRSVAARLEAAEVLAWAVRTLAASASAAPPPDSAAAAIRDLLATVERLGLDRPWSIASLAHHAGMGRTAFCQAFTATTGRSPRAWLEAQRMRLAARRLQESALEIRLIAAEVGYPDQFHFSRAFRRVIGVAPRAWRQRWRGRA